MNELPHLEGSRARGDRKRRAVGAAPPLGVRHWLLWFTCCAAYLAAMQALADRPPGAVGVLVLAILSVGYGAAWAGLAIFLARRCSARVYAIEPGEWLLAVLGGRLAVEVAVQFAPPWLLAAPQGVAAAATAFLLVLPLLSRQLPPIWKAAIAALFGLYVAPLAIVGLRDALGWSLGPLAAADAWLDRARPPLVLTALMAAVAADLVRRERRGWLHGVGVAAWLWMLLAGLAIRR